IAPPNCVPTYRSLPIATMLAKFLLVMPAFTATHAALPGASLYMPSLRTEAQTFPALSTTRSFGSASAGGPGAAGRAVAAPGASLYTVELFIAAYTVPPASVTNPLAASFGRPPVPSTESHAAALSEYVYRPLDPAA